MHKIISTLFYARDTAHKLHLKTKSFAKHVALGELYDGLSNSIDTLTEIIQGKYGILDLPDNQTEFDLSSEISFIGDLSSWAELSKRVFDQEDTHLLNEFDNIISLIYRTKYKLDNLS